MGKVKYTLEQALELSADGIASAEQPAGFLCIVASSGDGFDVLEIEHGELANGFHTRFADSVIGADEYLWDVVVDAGIAIDMPAWFDEAELRGWIPEADRG